MIEPTAIIHPDACIDDNVEIGAYSIIGADVIIQTGTVVGSHVVIKGPSIIGKNNRIFQFCSIGDDPQDKKYNHKQQSILRIGSGNVVREYVSIHRGTGEGGGETVVGNNNWIMAYVHIAHDCIVGNDNVFANHVTLAGHVKVDDHVILGGFSGVHQFCCIGSYSFSAISSVIVKDVPPFLLVAGNTARPFGLNREGLKRHGFSSTTIHQLRKAYRALYQSGFALKDALNVLAKLSAETQEISLMHSFIQSSKRGIAR